MKVLVIGNGGREHALVWKIAQSSRVDQVFCAPGNAGTAEDGENVNLAPTDFAGLIGFAKDNQIDLTVVGPEAPLATGIVDAFSREGLKVFGPSRAAGRTRSQQGVLQGDLATRCRSHRRVPHVPRCSQRHPLSPGTRGRADRGQSRRLGGRKGVFVCAGREQALDAVQQIADPKVFGEAGSRLVIEEMLHGQEASVLAITDGNTIVTLPPAQDHKRAFDGDSGPNTGGMGAYSPAPLVDDTMLSWVEEHILVPTVHAMKRARRPFHGVLYAGLMLTNQGPKVLEYNVRFGDPECQPILMRLQSDLVDVPRSDR